MDKNIDIAIAQYLDLTKEKYPQVESAYIFGSFAKGKSTDDSDIDLALIYNNLDDSKRFDIQVQLMLLASKIDSRIEPHPISLEDFNSGNPFVVEIKKTGIAIAALATKKIRVGCSSCFRKKPQPQHLQLFVLFILYPEFLQSGERYSNSPITCPWGNGNLHQLLLPWNFFDYRISRCLLKK